jgi:antirestriction protein
MPRAYAIQDKWMNEERNTIRDSSIAEPVFRYYPPLEYFGGSSVPEADSFYFKPLIVFAPHKNFPNIKMPCKRCTDGVFDCDASHSTSYGMISAAREIAMHLGGGERGAIFFVAIHPGYLLYYCRGWDLVENFMHFANQRPRKR